MLRAGGYGLLPIHDVAKDVIATFDCGRANLNSFLSDASHKMHEHRLGFTSVVFHEDVKGPLGYFTLSNDAIPLNSSEIFEFGIEDGHGLSAFPAVKIGRLAVSSAYHGRGVGGAVMNLILGEVLDGESLSSARLLIVDADNRPEVVSFYEKHRFVTSLWAERVAKNHATKGVASTVKMIRDVLPSQAS
jgi:ribosomal protein S18 acetylase RimI-like enzyme